MKWPNNVDIYVNTKKEEQNCQNYLYNCMKIRESLLNTNSLGF